MPHPRLLSAARSLVGALAVVAALHTPAAAAPFLSSTSAQCVGGGIGCNQVDFFFELLPPGTSATVDAFTITLSAGSGWFFNFLQAGESEDMIGPLLYTAFVSPDGLTLNGIFEPDDSFMDPWLRIRTEFTHDPDAFSSTAGLQYSYSLYNDDELIATDQSVVPEPVSMALLGTGLAGVAAARRRRRRAERDEAA